MKRELWSLAAAAILSATGCCALDGSGCGSGCGNGGCAAGGCGNGGGGNGGCGNGGVHPRLAGLKQHMHGGGENGTPDMGGPTAAIAYPYYANRGPRDWFEPNPPTIGY